jgi:hypothetical protein
MCDGFVVEKRTDFVDEKSVCFASSKRVGFVFEIVCFASLKRVGFAFASSKRVGFATETTSFHRLLLTNVRRIL